MARDPRGGEPDYIGQLNANNNLNLYYTLAGKLYPDDCNPYDELTIDSTFVDTQSFINKFKNSHHPLFLNINIQSLNSKYEKLKNFILTLSNNNIQIDLIAMQETWFIKHPQLLDIPGFQPLIFTNRKRGRGGGGWVLRQKWNKFLY